MSAKMKFGGKFWARVDAWSALWCVTFFVLGFGLRVVYAHAGGKGAVFEEERLHQYLLQGYVKDARPVERFTQPVNVSISFSFVRIEDLIETTDTFSATLFVVQTWHDLRLRWNASDYGGLEQVRLRKDRLWTPDIVLYNVAVQGTPESRYEDVVTVMADGTVIWVPMVTVYATCPLDFTRFPHDVQTCSLVFGSWTHSHLEMHVKFMSGNKTEMDVHSSDQESSSYTIDQHPQWTLVGDKARAKITMKSYSCCAEQYTVITISCTLARKGHFFTYLTLGPAAVLGALVPAIFLLPPSHPNKTTYGLLLMLCLTMMMVILEKAIPYSHGSTPHVASFYLGTMVLTSFSVLLSVLSIVISDRGRQRKPLPAWVHTIFLGRLGIRRMLCMGDYRPVDNVYSTALRSDDGDSGVSFSPSHTPSDTSSPPLLFPSSSSSSSSPTREEDTPGSFPAAAAAAGGSVQVFLREILSCVRFLMGKTAADEAYRSLGQQWEELARVVDRTMFIVFFVFYVFTAVSLLT